ncbi:hypothetical protein Ndes2437B_g07799 [Nannochloris sp. 'desiccata']
MPGLLLDLKQGITAVPGVAKEEGVAQLKMPDGSTIELPVLLDSNGAKFVDIRKLQPSTGICTFDPGFTSTAACESSITYIDGNKGVLLYRGYPIEELASKGDFYDSAFLLLHGELPDRQEKIAFEHDLKMHTLVNEHLMQFYRGFRHDAHPMAIMTGVVGALSAFYPEVAEIRNPQQQLRACYRLIAKMPTLAAMAYKTSIGQPIIYPKNDLTYAENFLHMMFAVPSERYEVDPELARALEIVFILHLDHEQNASTSTVRTAGSSQANPFACVASGIAALWGPAHGGANEAVLKMLEEIQDMGGIAVIPQVLERARDRNDHFRLMGFGHRVYKTFDPRAKLMAEVTRTVLKKLDQEDPLLDIALELERVALEDPYFKSRNLYPNVDFYSGIVLRAMGIPVSMYTVLFAMARTVGWVAQWKEMVSEPQNRISRPRQIYTGNLRRKFVADVERQPSGKIAVNGRSSGEHVRSSLLSRMVSTHARTALT